MGQKHSLGCVVAIDFGTTNSGFAYSIGKHEKPQLNPKWLRYGGRIETTILLDRTLKKAEAFGIEAADRYRAAIESDGGASSAATHAGCTYPPLNNDLKDAVLLEKIKLQILSLKDARDFRVKSVSGERIHATNAFAAALKYMKTQALEQILKKHPDIEERDIFWVVTVPAAWQYAQRNFMTLSADEAGLMMGSAKRFTILTESETSAEFCRSLVPEQFTNKREAYDHLKKENYIVVDAGGGTVDVSIVCKDRQDNIESYVHDTSGGRWGSETINERFEEVLYNRSPSVKKFLDSFKDAMNVWLEFTHEYEGTKRKIIDTDVAIHIKDDLVRYFQELVGESIFDAIGKNAQVQTDSQKQTITLEAQYMKERKFDHLFETWKELFYRDEYWREYDEFYEEFLSAEREYYEHKDRQHDVVVSMESSFLDKYKKMTGKEFGATVSKEEGFSFDEVNNELIIPSYLMSWGFYDKVIHDQGRQLSNKIKKHVELWRDFMKIFEAQKRKFSGDSDLVMPLKDFIKRYQSMARGNFLSDIEGGGIVFDSTTEEMTINCDTVKDKCFDPILTKLLRLLEKQYRRNPRIQVLYLVGGFGKHAYMQRFIRGKFIKDRDIKVLIPTDASISVLEGTIKFAYNRVSSIEHAAQHTFFVLEMVRQSVRNFRRETSPRSQCTTVIRKGDKVQVSEINRQEVLPLPNHLGENVVEVFRTSKKRQVKVDDGTSMCVFKCENGNAHVISISFTNDDVLVFLDEKDTGNSQAKRIPRASACTIM